ncbi:Minf_1886 family protein [Thalassoglobus sp.]|uniref:Minf_1886 family protein n=1 Tax=Thalassoglobus sp. TaxID=2795869 RepID=UPI003AA8FF3D
MSLPSPTAPLETKYHQDAYRFIYEALHHTQNKLDRSSSLNDEEDAHITGQELMHGVRELGILRYGLLTSHVFAHWGVHSTGDFGRIVFDMIERGEMRKTDRDQLSDFFDVYDFEDAFDHNYEIVAPQSDSE